MQNPPAAAAPLRIQDLPGPPGWPLLGNALQIQKERMHLQLQDWADRYGEVFRLTIGKRRMMVICNPEAIAKVLRDRPDGFQRTERLERITRELGLPGLFSVNGDAWRRQRPMVLGGLDPTHIRTFFPTLVTVTQRLARRWQRAADAGSVIDLQADLMRYTVDVTTALALGDDMNTLESTQDKTIQVHLNQVLPALFKRVLAPFDYWKFFPTPDNTRLLGHLDALRREVHALIENTRQVLRARPELREHPENLIQAMVAVRDQEGGGLTDEDVAGNVLTMLLAGEDTTANTLAWMVWLLFRNPSALARAREEAQTLLQGRTSLERSDELGKLEWIEACANEAMRLRPVAPLVFQQAVRDTVVEGVAVPARTLVICLLRHGAHDAKYFPDPEAFDPQRWIAGEAQSLSSAKRVAMPFGAGPRMCPGRYLALAEIKLAAAMLLGNFDLKDVSAPGGDPEERLAFAMGPVGLRMQLGRLQPA